MKTILRKLFLILPFIAVINFCYGQDSTEVPILKADSLASGNYKDILSSFYQLAIQNLTGPNKDFKFTTNPYAIMLKNDSSLKKFAAYKKYQLLRRFNIALDARLDSSYKFDGLAAGLTYAIIDRRDYTLREGFIDQVKQGNNSRMFSRLSNVLTANHLLPNSFQMFDDSIRGQAMEELISLNKALSKDQRNKLSAEFLNHETKLNSSSNTDTKTKEIIKEISENIPLDTSVVNQYYVLYKKTLRAFKNNIGDKLESLFTDTTLTFDKVDTNFKSWIFNIKDTSVSYLKKLTDSIPTLIIAKKQHSDYDSIVESFKKKALWTIGASDTTYSNGRFSKSAQILSEFLIGLVKLSKSTNIEFDTKATLNFMADSLSTNKNLSRQIFSFEPGINFVFRGRKNQQSYLEIKLAGSWNNTWRGLYKDEKQITNTFSANLRIRLYKDIWIPLQVRYDRQTHNVFGFLNVTTNFTDLGNMLGQKKSKS